MDPTSNRQTHFFIDEIGDVEHKRSIHEWKKGKKKRYVNLRIKTSDRGPQQLLLKSTRQECLNLLVD